MRAVRVNVFALIVRLKKIFVSGRTINVNQNVLIVTVGRNLLMAGYLIPSL